MSVSKPTYPASILASDFQFENLMSSFKFDSVYLGVGKLLASEITTSFADQSVMETDIEANFDQLGELAEKPGKVDSKLTTLKTRHYAVPGDRETKIELNINGLSDKTKKYLESDSFSSSVITIVCLSPDRNSAVIFNGLRWITNWSGEAGGLLAATIGTEFRGSTDGKIVLLKNIPEGV
jgi:hypothetical protein